MAGHRLDAEQVCRLHHVGALHGVGQPGPLPEIAAVEQQRSALSDIIAQAIDERFQMRETTELAESRGRLFEVDAGEGIGIGAVGLDAETVEKGLADQMRRPAGHRADADVDTGLAEIDRLELRVRIRHVQDARVAEAFEIVDARGISAARKPGQAARERHGSADL